MYVRESFSVHWLNSTDSAVAQSNHANSEHSINTFTQEIQVKQQNFIKKLQLEIPWLQVWFATPYLDQEYKFFKNLEENTKFYCQKCIIKRTPYSGATLQNFITYLCTADSISKFIFF